MVAVQYSTLRDCSSIHRGVFNNTKGGAHRKALAEAFKLLVFRLHLVGLLLDVVVAVVVVTVTTAAAEAVAGGEAKAERGVIQLHPLMHWGTLQPRAKQQPQPVAVSVLTHHHPPASRYLHTLTLSHTHTSLSHKDTHNDSCVTSGQFSSEGRPISLNMWSNWDASFAPVLMCCVLLKNGSKQDRKASQHC